MPWICTAQQLSALLPYDLWYLRMVLPSLVTGDSHGGQDVAQAAIQAMSQLLAAPDSATPGLLEAARCLITHTVGEMEVKAAAQAAAEAEAAEAEADEAPSLTANNSAIVNALQ